MGVSQNARQTYNRRGSTLDFRSSHRKAPAHRLSCALRRSVAGQPRSGAPSLRHGRQQ